MRQDNRFSVLEGFRSIEEMCRTIFGSSRSQLKKQFSRKELTKSVKEKDEVTIPLEISNRELVNPGYSGTDIPIIFEDDHLVVLNKPQGIHCQPLSYDDSSNCLSYLRSKNYFSIDSSREFGLINRLDGVTSGVLFIFKDDLERIEIRESFEQKVLGKEYLAIVEGEISALQELSHNLSGSGPQGSKMVVSEEGSPALLKLAPVAVKEGYTLVKVDLKSGVRHQIRAQLAHIGHPIVGDQLYGAQPAERVFLHSYRYRVKCPWQLYDIKAENAPLFELFFDLNSIL